MGLWDDLEVWEPAVVVGVSGGLLIALTNSVVGSFTFFPMLDPKPDLGCRVGWDWDISLPQLRS